jgi:hypothetical protein
LSDKHPGEVDGYENHIKERQKEPEWRNELFIWLKVKIRHSITVVCGKHG